MRKSTDDSYTSIMNFTRIDVCRMLDGMKGIQLLNSIMDVVKNLNGNLMECCKKAGDINAMNVTLSNASFLSFFPAGNFKKTYRFYDDIDDNIVNLTYYGTLIHQ